MRKFLNSYRQDINTNSEQLVAAWRETRERLKVDPTAPLPGLPGET